MSNAPQGTDEWKAARCGKITASRFSDVLTQPRSKADKDAGKLSETARSYMLDIIAEIITGEPQSIPTTRAMQWGIDNEDAARQLYEEFTGSSVGQTGFLDMDGQPYIGGSPDGLVSVDGGIEIKCPFCTRIHLGYFLDDELPKAYAAQVHGLMWITGRKWWDFVSYDPRISDLKIAFFRKRIERDETIIADLAEKVFNFRDKLIETLHRIQG